MNFTQRVFLILWVVFCEYRKTNEICLPQKLKENTK